MSDDAKHDSLEKRVAELERLLKSGTYPFDKCPQCGSMNVERVRASAQRQQIANSYNQVEVCNRCKDCEWEWYRQLRMS